MPRKPSAPAPTDNAADIARPDAAAPERSAIEIRRETAILAAIYPAAEITPRDLDYLAFYCAAESGRGFFTVSDLLALGAPGAKPGQRRNPYSANPSAPATDAGAHKRAQRFGHIARVADAPDGSARFSVAPCPTDDTDLFDAESGESLHDKPSLARILAFRTTIRNARRRAA